MARWTAAKEPNPHYSDLLTREVTKDPLLGKLLAGRGLEDFEGAKAYFRSDLQSLHNPFRMKDMEAAVERIEKARIAGEQLMIYGDYDVDGTTSVATLMLFLKDRLPHLEAYVPDRYKEGYGLSFEGINLAEEMGITLIIALDCGTKAFDQIAHAKQKGIDVIVCDHHRPEETLPNAVAVLNPKRKDCPYPYKELSGCGVGFKLCQALTQHWGLQPEQHLYPLMELCAVSIAADMVPTTGENRTIAQHGLHYLRQGPFNQGLKHLIFFGKKSPAGLTFRDLGFFVGPRINAAGRISQGLDAVKLLLGSSAEEIQTLTAAIEAQNTERRAAQQTYSEQALAALDTANYPNSTVVYHPDWLKGVIGLVASRLLDHHYRPTVVLTKSGDTLAGSARSVDGFDMYAALEACQDHLIQFGGHTMAAGMTMHEAQLPQFQQAFEAYATAHLSEEQKERNLVYHAEADLADFSDRFYGIFRQMEPFGPGNEEPVFLLRNLRDAGSTRAVGTDNAHLKLHVAQEGSQATMSGIAFGHGELEAEVKSGSRFDALATLTENHFNGTTSIELMVIDIRLQ